MGKSSCSLVIGHWSFVISFGHRRAAACRKLGQMSQDKGQLTSVFMPRLLRGQKVLMYNF